MKTLRVVLSLGIAFADGKLYSAGIWPQLDDCWRQVRKYRGNQWRLNGAVVRSRNFYQLIRDFGHKLKAVE